MEDKRYDTVFLQENNPKMLDKLFTQKANNKPYLQKIGLG